MHFKLKRAPHRLSFNRRSFNGLCFRGQITMNPVSRKTDKGKLVPGATKTRNMMPSNLQSGDVDRCDFDEEERHDYSNVELWRNRLRFPGHNFWDFKMNILGVKDDTPIYFCDTCKLPIKIYGRMIPCKHIFCYGCAVLLEQKANKLCSTCNSPIQRIDQYALGTLFMCTVVQGCKRTYLSQRDLGAHVIFRHLRSVPSVTPLMKNVPTPVVQPPPEVLDQGSEEHQVNQVLPEQGIRMPPSPLLLEPHTQPGENFPGPSKEFPVPLPPPLNCWVEQDPYRFSTKKKNKIIFPSKKDSNPHVKKPLLPLPTRYSEYQDERMISQPNPILPSWRLYGVPQPRPSVHHFPTPPPPPPAARYPVQLPSYTRGMSSVDYSQALLPSATSGPPQMSPSFDYAMRPYVDHLSPGQLPPRQPVDLPVNVPGCHHYYPGSWLPPPEDKETHGLPYTQPWEMDPDSEPAPKRLRPTPPPAAPWLWQRQRRMQGPPEHLHPGQSRDDH